MNGKLETTESHQKRPVSYFTYFSFFFGRRAPRSFILSFMLNRLLRSTTKEHFMKKTWETRKTYSCLTSYQLSYNKYYRLKFITRHHIIVKNFFNSFTTHTFVMVVFLDPVLLVLNDWLPIDLLSSGL